MRQRTLYHPLWAHIPALAILGLMIYRFFSAMPLPDRVPLQFDFGGVPTRWGSPWELFATVIGIGFLWLGISILCDELWARQERRKTFNWMSLLDEAVIGMMAGAFLSYGDFHAAQHSGPGWPVMLHWMARLVIVAAVLEYFRPFVPHEESYQPEDTGRLEAEIGAYLEEGKPWVYWENQNPAWLTWVVVVSTAYMFFGAGQAYSKSPTIAAFVLLPALLLFALYGGLRVIVSPVRLQVRLGVFGIPVLKIWLRDVTEVKLHEFSPLKDFGGYGIRVNREMKAYYMRGNRGALVTTSSGKKYLVGSDHPERLAAVLDVARRMAG